MMRALALVALLVACGSKPPATTIEPISNQAATPVASPAAPPTAELDALLLAVLTRFEADEETVPDSGMLTSPVVYIVFDDAVSLGPAAFPPAAKHTYVVKTMAQVQAEADDTGQNINYIGIGAISREANQARFWIGVDFAMPSAEGGGKLCCCKGEVIYELRAGAWTFTGTGMAICS